MQHRKEGTTNFVTNSEEKITKKMPVFYNPLMKLNRDLSLLMLCTMKNPKIGLPMEASGVRAARIVNELITPGYLKPHALLINDISPSAIKIAKQNVTYDASFSVEDANNFLRKNKPFDYIDIDPFGTPNPFLDAAVQGLRKDGIIAVTATDTSALAGTYPRATARKYWSTPSRTWAMHDLGLRILIRKVQLVAAQHGKALTPVLSVATHHYYRIFFTCTTGANNVKTILAQHKYVHVNTKQVEITVSEENTSKYNVAGPMWTGTLHDPSLVKQLLKWTEKLETTKARELLTVIQDECRINTVGFTDVHELVSVLKIQPPKREVLFKKLGKHACRTHISPTGFKTDLSAAKLKTYLDPHMP